jgi:subtilisin-like proprotein convertase family protein
VQPVSFADGFGPGYFFGGTRTVPATNATWLRVHVWTAGLTWEQARAESSAEWGVSAPVRVDLPSAAGDSPTPPPLLTRLLPLRFNQGAAPPPLSVTLPASVSESDGVVAGAGRVWLAETLSSNLTIALISSDTNRLTVPAEIVIPANQLSATFDLAMANNWLAEGNQTVNVTASAAGFVGGASFLIVLEDDIAPTVQTHPANQTVEPGQTATFTVIVSGSDPLAYHWRFNSTNILAGETNDTLTLSGVTLSQAGGYSVLVTNAYGSVTSAPAQLIVVLDPPVIKTQPVSQTVVAGGTAIFSVTASGRKPLAYQWRFNDTNIFAGETNTTLTLNGITPAQAGSYSVVVTNVHGSVTSAPAQLTLAQVITCANPASLSIPASGKASLYPSVITVSNLAGTLVRASVTLNNLSHTWPDDLDILLMGPAGQKVLLMSDAGGSTDITGSVLTFADSGPALPDSAAIAPGTYHPTDYETTDVLPAPAPGRPYNTNLAVFIGTDPNGTWSLFVNHDSSGDSGNLAGGWSMDFALAPPLRITSAHASASVFSLSFLSAAGTNYTVQYKTNLTDAVWQTLTTRSGTGSQLTVTAAVTQCTSRYYRVRQE